MCQCSLFLRCKIALFSCFETFKAITKALFHTRLHNIVFGKHIVELFFFLLGIFCGCYRLFILFREYSFNIKFIRKQQPSIDHLYTYLVDYLSWLWLDFCFVFFLLEYFVNCFTWVGKCDPSCGGILSLLFLLCYASLEYLINVVVVVSS